MENVSVTTRLWLVPAERPCCAEVVPTAQELTSWASLQGRRAAEVRWSRGWLRRCLADHFRVPAEDLPLLAPPGLAPSLAPGWGFVSLSHCIDALAIGWSDQPIGIDLERLDRPLPAWPLAQRFFCMEDLEELQGLETHPLRRAVLRQWVAKEAAIKWSCGSLAQDLQAWSCPSTAALAHHQGCGVRVPIQRYELGDWCLAVAGPKARQSSAICLI